MDDVISEVKDGELVKVTDGAARVRCRRWLRVILQLFDFEILQILLLNHKTGLSGSSAPQRLLTLTIAIFEAVPEV